MVLVTREFDRVLWALMGFPLQLPRGGPTITPVLTQFQIF